MDSSLINDGCVCNVLEGVRDCVRKLAPHVVPNRVCSSDMNFIIITNMFVRMNYGKINIMIKINLIIKYKYIINI